MTSTQVTKGSRIPRGQRNAALAMFILGVVAWHHPSVATAMQIGGASGAVATAAVNHRFGDTLTHNVRVLSMAAETESANVALVKADNLIVLAVVPGREIEVIYPGDMEMKKDRIASNIFMFSMKRLQAGSGLTDPGAAAAERQAYERCRASAAKAKAAQKPVKLDGSGKPTDSRDLTSPICEMSASSAKRSSVRKPMPPREPAERYLVVLSSSSRVPDAELESRLASLTTFAPDVALTIEAIAAGIYAGYPGTFGGTFVNW